MFTGDSEKTDFRTIADEVLVINLPERVDRRSRVSALLVKEKIPFRFMDGVRVTRKEICEDEISELHWAEFKISAGWDAYLQAVVGCKRAHIKCLEYGLDSGLNTLLILEDDVAFCENWYPLFSKARDNLPEGWLQLYLSAGFIRPPMATLGGMKRLSAARHTTAILYSREGIEAALNCVRRARAELDWWMGLHLHPYGCSYVVDPQISYQTGGYSDCRGAYRVETA